MIKKGQLTFCIAILAISTFAPAIVASALARATPQGALSARVIRQVRHELVTLPYYGVFDWLEFEVRPDNTVVLRGQGVRPTTKSDAEARGREIDGVAGGGHGGPGVPPPPGGDRIERGPLGTACTLGPPLFVFATQN